MTSIFSQDCFQGNIRLGAALSMADVGCWEFSLLDHKFWMSERFQSHFAFSGSSIASYEDMIELIHICDRDNVRKSLHEALVAESGGKFDVRVRTHAGHLGNAYWVNWKGQANFSSDGTPVHFSGIVQDITNQVLSENSITERNTLIETILAEKTMLPPQQVEKTRFLELEDLNQQLAVVNEEYTAANEELIQTNQLLSKSNDNLRQFAYIASHDLQEPLRKIQSFGDLFRRKVSVDLDGIEYLDRMQQAAKRMSVLIDELLTFSHVSSREIEFGIVDLDEVFKGILSDLETSIDQSEAVIIVPPLPSLKGDARQLSQLFQNLLSNAIKFRRHDVHPRIQVTWNIVKAANVPLQSLVGTPGKSYDRIDITDNGIGFDMQHEEKIFKVFQRLHGKSEYDGTGIGLAICEKVAANHNGLIKVASQVGIGTTFSIYLPIQ